ncbi:FAD-dependent oxidoreductase [Streptomyces sp. NPDC048172]|uniref:FAD-dependent oxidoreductase n=1 Tax=Streptomyces sp. NPDC048172 TaxID=3365505 RepID=UPI0037139876
MSPDTWGWAMGATGTTGTTAHAVVLGAGMSGLFAARALTRTFARVTVVERDRLPAGPEPRKGVPQGRHVHALLGTGAQAIERLLPGLGEELRAAGAVTARLLQDARYVLGGAPLARGDAGVSALQATRPLLEATVRARVAALPGVTFLEGRDVLGPEAGQGRVTGVRVRLRREDAEEEVLRAGLVVDAMGRAGHAAGWTRDLGHGAPPEERLKVDVGYATRFVALPEDVLDGDRMALVGNVPGLPTRGAALALQEGGRWLLTLAGMAGDHPPTDDDGFLAYARTTLPSEVYEAVRDAGPSGATVFHRFPQSLRRRFEKLPSHPEGLIAVGDGVSSFNPVYAQGMTVAAQEAEALAACLDEGGPDGLPARYFAAAARVVEPAWAMARNADLSVPQVPAERPLAWRLLGRYAERLVLVARHDPEAASRYVRVTQLLDPPSALFAPKLATKVLRGPRRP